MTDTADLALRRYGDALRRWWWVVAGAGVLLALVLAGPAGGTATGGAYVVDARLLVVDNTDLFGEGIDTPPRATQPFRAFADLMASDGIERTVETELGRSVEVTIRGLDQSRTLAITARGSTQARADEAVDAYVALARRLRSEDLADVVRQGRAILQAQLAALASRVADVDRLIDAAPADAANTPRIEAIRDERERLVEERSKLEITDRLFVAVGDGGVESVQVLDRKATRSGGVAPRAYSVVFGALAGGVAGAALVIVRTALTRRVRTTADIERITGASSVVGTTGPDGTLSPLVARALIRKAAGRALYVFGVGVDGEATAPVHRSLVASDPDETSDARRGAAGPGVIDAGRIDGPGTSSPLPGVRDEAAAVIVVYDGRTLATRLDETVRALGAADVALAGVVVAGGGRFGRWRPRPASAPGTGTSARG